MTHKTDSMNLPFKLWTKGKVRDVYDLGDQLLIVATDRISAYDFVLPTPVPDKGKILCQMSNFWFEKLKDVCPNHLVATSVADFPEDVRRHSAGLEGRSVLVKKAKRVDIECVVRGFLAGSGWKEYQEGGAVCGVQLPAGLVESAKLPEPIFTPATKAPDGEHDQNISFEEMAARVGQPLAAKLRQLSLTIFKTASFYAEARGFYLADTKFEFGELDGKIILIDEALTPDSSRFWDRANYIRGRSQDSFDKQIVRDYLNKIKWNRKPPVPALPAEVVQKTREKYIAAYERLTGKHFL
ncbi:MAG: phosphoribosylaminoimidazolesuccinocarboxamide synthase [Elusimicrobia bacterium]|nr:phosphoribosylaminoimidazolesuccinocarboxamide synthase [Elusimicrobiota bacterium]